MCNYDINKLRKAQEEMSMPGNDFNQAYRAFCKELENVPHDYYGNIFFPGKAGDEQVIAKDIILNKGDIYCNVSPIEGGTEKTVKFVDFPAFSIEMARNIIGAIEVAEISRKTTKEQQLKEERIRRELELAEKRKQNKE